MPDRSTPPPFVYNNRVNLLPAVVYGEGADRVHLVSGGTQDVVRVEWVLPAGRWYEPQNGATHYTSALINKGTRSRSARQIAEELEQRGVHFEVHAGADFVTVSLLTLTRFLGETLAVVKDVLQSSIFPEEELRLARENYVQVLRINREKTSYLAGTEMRKVIFGAEHPYGRELDESASQVIDTSLLKSFFHQHFSPTLTMLSGKAGEKEARMVQEMLRGSAGRTSRSHTLRDIKPSRHHLLKSGSVQSSIRMEKLTLDRKDPRYFEFGFLVHLLGGYFGSRLMKNIREEKGLTYGIHATLQPHVHASLFSIGADVNAENKDLAIEEILKEVSRLRTDPIDPEELTIARNHLVGSLQSELTTPFAHADRIRMLLLHELPLDYFQEMVLAIERATPNRLQELAEENLHEDSLTIVTAG